MARHRFTPLIVAVVLGFAALVARLYQVQIGEGAIWSAQAAGLVRSGSVEPYERGAILDAAGRVIARDRADYSVSFSYRDFRRKHPLGLVAHARSTLLGEPVALRDALLHLVEWADELVALSPGELDEFARGGALLLGNCVVPASAEPDAGERWARRNDVRFYVARLLELDLRQSRELAKRARTQLEVPLLELAAAVRGGGDAEGLRARLHARIAGCSAELEGLALQLESDALAAGEPPSSEPLERLLARLESWREAVEDAAATDLFRDAVGFAAARVEPHVLADSVDLRWLARLLQWDDARTLRWLARARESWRDSLLLGQAQRIAVELEYAGTDEGAPERVLSSWAALFAAREVDVTQGWRACRTLAVLDDMHSVFTTPPGDDEDGAAPVLPFQDAEFLEALEQGSASWSSVARAELGAPASDAEVALLAAQWERAFGERVESEFVLEHTATALMRWEDELQAALATRFARRRAAAAEDGRPAPQLALAEGRLDRAAERANYVLKDHGSRPQFVARHPSYATVLLLTRHRDRFAGFAVQDARERARLEDERGVTPAAALVGRVGAPSVRDALVQRDLQARFAALRALGSRTEEQRSELLQLARRVLQPDELHGRGGLEAYLDPELSGRNGYLERRGLQEVIDGTFKLAVAPQDGDDVQLTLDLDLQQAALRSLAHPDVDRDDPASSDYAWLAAPTGAIVLASVDGDVLAAASFPDVERTAETTTPARDRALERTLLKPGFQPPGSCFKVFVASWALDHAQFDPQLDEPCVALPDGSPGYVDVHCNATHGAADLRRALTVSCNSYFARLGERLELEDWRGLAAEFGFGQPTGVRCFGVRDGLREDTLPRLFAFERGLSARDRRVAANGLSCVEVTPMQLARATAGLATGVLPQMRLVQRIGAREVPPGARRLALTDTSLKYVREAMLAVANEPSGSGQRALNAAELGFRMAAKTGSGDLATRKVVMADLRPRALKDTWVIGYFPYERPRFVVVVLCTETYATSSHGAIWLARQFLTQPEVQALVAREQAR